MSEDLTKVLEQNTVLEEIIRRMFGVMDENEAADENFYETSPGDSDNSTLENNNSALTNLNSDEIRIELYQALVGKHLLIPIKALSSEEHGSDSDDALTVEPITQISPTNEGEDIIAFTSVQKFQSHLGVGQYIICDVEAILNLVLQGGFKALVINPGNYWVGILSEDIKSFYNIDNE